MSVREELQSLHTKLMGLFDSGTAPPNEAAVGQWIVLPTLQALGYENFEILPEMTGGPPGRPDFTVLEGKNECWFVELKSWQVVLSDSHADQAINYAHARGARWILLTNGREWRIYDDHRRGTSRDRLVATVLLSSKEDWIATLQALDRGAVVGGEVARQLARRGLGQLIPPLLFDADGAVVKQIVKMLSPTLHDVRAEDVARFFRDAFETATPPIIKPVIGPSPDDEFSPPPRSTMEEVEVTLIGKRVKNVRGVWNGKTLIVKKGSCGRAEAVPSVAAYRTKLQKKQADGKTAISQGYLEVLEDIEFPAPSSAAVFILGWNTNGWNNWKLSDGRPLSVLRRNSSPE